MNIKPNKIIKYSNEQSIKQIPQIFQSIQFLFTNEKNPHGDSQEKLVKTLLKYFTLTKSERSIKHNAEQTIIEYIITSTSFDHSMFVLSKK